MSYFLENISDIIGLVGVTLMLTAYFLINIHRMTVKSLKYQFLNFFGSLMVLYSLYFSWNLSAAIVESVWMLISMLGIYQIARKFRR